MFTGGSDRTIRLWDLENEQSSKVFSSPSQAKAKYTISGVSGSKTINETL